MSSVFDRPISLYRGVRDTVGTEVSLLNFLMSKRHKERILHLRSLSSKGERDREKLSLPLATVSGLFRPRRTSDNLVSHSGFICIDIDAKDNPTVHSMEDVRSLLTLRPEVAFASLSVSGTGMFAVIPLAQPRLHLQHFRSLESEYRDLGIVIDRSCSDVCRLRCVSYDDNPYINPGATPFERYTVETMPDNLRPAPVRENNDIRKVERCCEVIRQHKIDITGSYTDWMMIGASLSSLGEDGRYYFHLVSSMSEQYSFEETERKFTNLMNHITRIGIATFFYICSLYGVSYRVR